MNTATGTIEDMSDEAALDALLAPIRARNRDRLLARLSHVRDAISGEAEIVEPSPELRADLHALIGALGTYGWPAGSELITEVQSSITTGRRARHLLGRLDALIAEVSAS